MESLQTHEVYEKCKKIVKQWENNFRKNYGRPPSKLDIREADKDVRHAYCTYFKLKTAALEESLMDVLNEDDDNSTEINTSDLVESPSSNVQEEVDNSFNISSNVESNEQHLNEDVKIWGEHLNKKVEPENKVISSVNKPNLNFSFTKKLFANSKFTKRNPRKSLNTSRHNSSTNIFLSQPTTSTNLEETKCANIEDKNETDFNSSLPLKMNSSSFSRSQSVNVISHLLGNSNNSVRQIDKGWLQRVAETTRGKLPDFVENKENNDFEKSPTNNLAKCFPEEENDDIISDSDDESSKMYHISKRIKLSPTNSYVNNSNLISLNNSCNNQIETYFEKEENKEKNTEHEIEICHKLETKSKAEKTSKDEYEFEDDSEKDIDSDYEQPTNKKRKRNSKVTKEEMNKKKTQTKRTKKLNTRSVKSKTDNKADTNETNDENKKSEDFEMEYSIKPPPATVPRYKNIKSFNKKTDSTEEIKPLTKRELAKDKLLKKIESGNLNDNFVKIDIKKKVFVKGKRHMNFSKFKKQQWKNKKKSLYGPDMDMGGCDGGELVCFKCGKTGHMARNCKEKLIDTLLPLGAIDEDECLLPSLEEASQMAKESSLAIRVPNMLYRSESKNSEECKDSDAGSKVSELEIEDDEELEKFMLYTEVMEEGHTKSLQEINRKWMKVLEENTVKPFYELNDDGSLPETPKEVFDILKQFGHKSFRSGQEQAIMRILCGQSTLVTLSTGSGKSLCYQLPAYLYSQRQKCVSLIISPLVSLMDDQVSGMPSFLKAACLHTSQTAIQKEKILKLIEEGEVNILLVSPEAVTSGEKKSGFGAILRQLPPIAFACIDEAHCVSQWSHNFRPSYLVICRVLRERLGIQTILGLTATSTYATSTSIVDHLQIPDGRSGVISDIPLPDNLFLSASKDIQKDVALRNLLMSDPFNEFDSIIIYCTRREECERIAGHLRTSIRAKEKTELVKKYKSLSKVAEPYHAGLAASKRRSVQNAFMSGHLRIVVATVAFGMGINKSDIRCVIHYNMPRNFESYVQEVGRAGRDGLPAQCHLFLDSEGKDQNELRRHIYANSMDRHQIRKLLQKIFVSCDCKQICPRHEVSFSIQETVKLLDVPEENISTLLCYLELHERQYLEVLTPVYTKCKIISYGGAKNIIKAAKDCPPLAMALALQEKGETDFNENIFEFPVVDIAAAMGWDSGFVKKKLKNLEWITENNTPKRSTLSVEFSNLGFRVRSPGNLSPNELDEALDSLYAKKKDQEIISLKQLQVVCKTLTNVAENYYHLCLTESYLPKSSELKSKIREYFSCEKPLKDVDVDCKAFAREAQIIADVRNLIAMYRDNSFTGRAVARIFHGIQSPNYPAVIWGRCKFWRAHLNSDFNKICQIATQEILRIK